MKDNVALKEARAKLAEIERQRAEAVINFNRRVLREPIPLAVVLRLVKSSENRRMEHDQT